MVSRNSLKTIWTFTTSGRIWRLLPAESGEFVGEARDEDKKQVSFFALHGDSGTPLWQNLVLNEQWWIGIEDVSNGVLLLHGFATPDLPGHLGIIAIDLSTGKELWTNRDLTFWFVYSNSILTHKSLFEKRLFFELDLRSGDTIREYDQDSETVLLQMRSEAIHRNRSALEFPESVDLGGIELHLARVMRRKVPADILNGRVELLQFGNYLMLNYHILSRESSKDASLLDNHFKIIDLKKESVVFSDILSRHSKAAVPDSFFLKGNVVYFIKDQKTLTAVRLDS